MLTGRKDELSLHMRIPADKCYLGNALLTLEGICEHFSVCDSSKENIKSALQKALDESINLSYQESTGLFDLKFSVYKDKLQITVEDFMLNDDQGLDTEQIPVEENTLRQTMKDVMVMVDEFKILKDNGRHSCYSMQFNLRLAE